MRVLLWSSTFWPHIGGVEVLALHYLRELRERGHEVLVLARRDTADLADEEVVAGVDVVRYPFRQALEMGSVEKVIAGRWALTRIARRFAPDVLHLYHPGPDVLFHRLARAELRAPSIVTLHQAYPAAVLGATTAIGDTLRGADWVAACSSAVLEEVRTACPTLDRSSVIPNELPPAGPTSHRHPPKRPTLLLIGRLVPQKGFDLGLQAFKAVIGAHSGARLLVAGDGPERARLERMAVELGLAATVEFLGWVPPEAVVGLMGDVTAVVMPSRFEPFGLVALQAAQAGRPVIGFGVGGLREAVVDGETGTLVEAGDVDALTRAIISLLDEPARAEAMGRAGRERSSSPARWSAHVDAYEHLYERVRHG